MKVQSVLVEFECSNSTRIISNCGFLFGAKLEYLITTSNILMHKILQEQEDQYLKHICCKANYELQNIEELLPGHVNLKVVKMQHNKKVFEDFKVVMFFISQEIEESAHKLLFDWDIDDKVNGRGILNGLSMFFISQNITNGPFDFAHLSKSILDLWNLSKIGGEVERLQNVFIESAPFGNRHFLDSYSEGIVSNVIGTNNCLFLSDCTTVPGCEGAVIFRKPSNHQRKEFGDRKIPIGIVLSSYNIWKGDYLVLTIGASLQCILRSLIKHPTSIEIGRQPLRSFKSNNSYDSNILAIIPSVVLIKAWDSWGSAILYDKKKGIFITNSHVVENCSFVELQWKDLKISCKVLFRTYDEQIYDLAILQCVDADLDLLNKCDLQPAKINTQRKILKGEAVVCISYPLFDASQHDAATVTSGHVMQVLQGSLRTTCTVLPGSSGGGVFARSDGCLLGVMVCNARVEGVNYANVNMAVPVTAFADVLIDYMHSGDSGVLDRLSTKDDVICKDWRFTLSKL